SRTSRAMNGRRAFTLLELTAAAAITVMLMATSLQMMHALTEHARITERRIYAEQAIGAVAEQIGSMAWDEVTSESASRIGVPAALVEHLPGAKLAVAVKEESSPAAKRIMLELTWQDRHGQTVEPLRLTTWEFPAAASKE